MPIGKFHAKSVPYRVNRKYSYLARLYGKICGNGNGNKYQRRNFDAINSQHLLASH